MKELTSVPASCGAAFVLLLLTLTDLVAADRWWDAGNMDIGTNGDGASTYGLGTWSTSIQNWDQGIGLAHVAWDNAGLDNAIFAGTYSSGTKLITLNSSVTVNQIKVLTGDSASPTSANRYDIGSTADAVNAITFGGTYSTTTPAIDASGIFVRNNNFNAKITGSPSGGLVIAHGSNGADPSSGRFHLANAANDFVGDVTLVSGNTHVSGNFGAAANNIILSGGSLFGSTSTAITYTLTRNIVVAANSGINLNATTSATGIIMDLQGAITGSAKLTRYSGPNVNGEVKLSGDMSGYTGIVENTGVGLLTIQTTVTSGGGWKLTAGTVKLNTSDDTHIANGAGKTNLLMNGGTLNMNGKNETINGLEGRLGSTVENALADTVSTLTLGDSDATAGFGGIIRNSSGAGGILAITKIGAGTQTLTNAHTYSGNTTISNGTLALSTNGTLVSSNIFLAAKPAVFDVSSKASYGLASGKTIQGNGTVRGTLNVNAGATFTVGGSTGTSFDTLTNTGSFTLNGTNVLRLDADSHVCDQIYSGGTVTLSNCVLEVNNVNGTYNGGDQFTLFVGGSFIVDVSTVSIIPVSPGAGLAWDKTLLSSGILKVMSAVAPSFAFPAIGLPASTNDQCQVVLVVAPSGSSPLTNYWSVDGVDAQIGPSPTFICQWPSSSTAKTVTVVASNDLGTATSTANVTLNDTMAPTIALTGVSPVGAVLNTTYTDAGFTVSDNCTASNALTIETHSTVDTSTPGTYSIYYTATDAAGHTSTTATRIVQVVSSYVFTKPAGGSWTASANWQSNLIANGVGSPADFSTLTLASDTTVTLDGAKTVGSLWFDDQNATKHHWAIAPGTGGTLTLAKSPAAPGLVSNNVPATINATLAGTQGLLKKGAGPLLLTNAIYAGGTTVDEGTLQFGVGTATGTLPTGDITNSIEGTTVFFRSNQMTIANVFAGNGTNVFKSTGLPLQGEYLLAGNNGSFTGVISVDKARIQDYRNSANNFGASSTRINVADGGTLWAGFSGRITFPQTLNIAGQGWLETVGPLGALRLQNNSLWSGPITLTANARIGVASGQSGTINGPVSGAYELELYGGQVASSSGVLTNAATVNSTSATRINGSNAVVVAGSATAFSSGPLTLQGAGTLKLNSYSFTYANLASGSGNVQIQNGHSSTPSTLTVGADNSSTAFAGTLADGGAAALALSKVGAGVLTLDGPCTHTGPTGVGSGALLVNSSYASAITVSDGATLGGIGILNSNVVVLAGGTLSPGASIGTLTINRDLDCAGHVLIEVDKTDAMTNDHVVVIGTVMNSGAGTLTLSNRNLTAPFAAGDKFQVFNQAMINGAAMSIVAQPPLSGLVLSNKLELDGSIEVVGTATGTPPHLTNSVSGGNLYLSWPADHLGWRLEIQTNALSWGLRTNWVAVPGSDGVTATNFPIDRITPTTFYRLVYP